ncbi:DUF4166 domain-containing protein [Leifsonia sp. NPDC058230]|uniref:DUF4166 domain-containing protein n=1 Tax=Leifsonia sp. NPDC058230 TaxID=3346391 RepID=UPI0036DA88CD
MASPYETVLGERLAELHPRLRGYFEEIPAGCHGFGEGVFDTVGTPRRWLWPVLSIVASAHVAFPTWERGVPFTVVNRPESGSVRAERVFELRSGRRTMIDLISADAGMVVDRLGSPARLEARLSASVVDGGLRMESIATALLLGRLRIPVPRFAAPRVTLSERYDAVPDAQRVSITVDLPLIGRLYEYAGSFRYEIRTGERTA